MCSVDTSRATALSGILRLLTVIDRALCVFVLTLITLMQYDALNKYGHDLVKDAEDGKFDPVIGRDAEIR